MCIVMVCLSLNQDFVSTLFTTDAEDIKYIKEVLDLMFIYVLLDTVHGVNTGLVRALGKQFKASVATLCCYYLVGMPLAILFGFQFEMDVRGFWLAFTIGILL